MQKKAPWENQGASVLQWIWTYFFSGPMPVVMVTTMVMLFFPAAPLAPSVSFMFVAPD